MHVFFVIINSFFFLLQPLQFSKKDLDRAVEEEKNKLLSQVSLSILICNSCYRLIRIKCSRWHVHLESSGLDFFLLFSGIYKKAFTRQIWKNYSMKGMKFLRSEINYWTRIKWWSKKLHLQTNSFPGEIFACVSDIFWSDFLRWTDVSEWIVANALCISSCI